MRILKGAALIAAFAAAGPALADTITVEAGEGAQERLQEALILAAPGDEIVLGVGRFVLTDGLSLDVDRVTLRGAGMDERVRTAERRGGKECVRTVRSRGTPQQ